MARIAFNKAYLGNNLIYKIDSSFIYMGDGVAPSVCPVVIPSITGYEGGEMEVYALDDEKWYEMNNLGQYEEYGIMPTVNDLNSTTYYDGKLVIYNTHEYEYHNGQWVDLGYVGSSRIIQSPSYIYNNANNAFKFSIPLNYTASTDTRIQIQFQPTNNGGTYIFGETSGDDNDDYRVFWYGGYAYFDIGYQRISVRSPINRNKNYEYGNYYIKDLDNNTNLVTGSTQTFQRTNTVRLGYTESTNDTFTLSGLTMFHGDTKSREFIPAIDNGEVCLYDKVSGEFFKSDNGKYPLSGGTVQQVEVGTITPVKEYEEKPEIEQEVTVLSLDDIQCPFEGMIAHVGDNTYTYVDGEWMHSPINYQPLVITTTEKSFLLPNFDIYAGRDSKVTEVAILANIANQTTNVRFVNTQISEPWYSRYGWGLWKEGSYFAPKPIDETWFKSATTLNDYAGSIYWFVVDSFGNFKIYSGTSADTAPTGSPVYTFNNKSSVSSSYQLTTNDVRFFGVGGDSDSAVKNSTIYRVNINDGNATYTGDYVPIVDGGTQYMLNVGTNNRYEINTY